VRGLAITRLGVVMSAREVGLLRDRALRILGSAKSSLVAGDYDIAAFLADQAIQLYLKSATFQLAGEIPRVHSVRQLFQIFGAAIQRQDEIEEFTRKNRSLIIRLEDAYINSRYVPREYDRDEASELVTFTKRAVNFVKNLEHKASAKKTRR